jgi:putative transcriptional regulator
MREAFSREVDVTQQTILFMEKGKHNPLLRLAYRVAILFERPIEEVFSFEDEEGWS